MGRIQVLSLRRKVEQARGYGKTFSGDLPETFCRWEKTPARLGHQPKILKKYVHTFPPSLSFLRAMGFYIYISNERSVHMKYFIAGFLSVFTILTVSDRMLSRKVKNKE